MVEETPLKVKEPTFSWNQECGSGFVCMDLVYTRIVNVLVCLL